MFSCSLWAWEESITKTSTWQAKPKARAAAKTDEKDEIRVAFLQRLQAHYGRLHKGDVIRLVQEDPMAARQQATKAQAARAMDHGSWHTARNFQMGL